MTTTLFPGWGKKLNKFAKKVEQMAVVSFSCWYCNVGEIELNTEEYKASKNTRMKRKCPACGEFVCFRREGDQMRNVKKKDKN